MSALAASGMAGIVHRPGDPGYDGARGVWQRAVDPRPALVVEAADEADVQAAVRVARERGLPLAVAGSGHGAVDDVEGALLLRTAGVTGMRVDAAAATATVGGGATWGDVLDAAEPHGLAPVCGSTSSVGVAGYTLQGGAGWLSRLHGFGADNLLAARVVTADGQVVTASAREHPDLFWALRGGGGAFGVVTSLTFRLHAVGPVLGGMSLHPADRAPAVFTLFRDRPEPRELNTAVMLVEMADRPGVPLRGQRVLAVRPFATGDLDAARAHLAPLLEAAGPPLVDGVAVTGFAAMLRGFGPPPPPTASVERVHLLDDLADATLDALLDAGSHGPLACVDVKRWGGAIADPGPDAGPVSHRDSAFCVTAAARLDGRCTPARTRAAVDGVGRLGNGGSLLTLLPDPADTASAFTREHWARLVTVKRAWDPDDVLRTGHRIPTTPEDQ